MDVQAAFAQQTSPDYPVASAPIHFGVIGVRPRLSVSNVGVDTNVFNSVSDPQRDFTFTVSPATDTSLYVGRFGGGLGYTVGDQLRASFNVKSIYRSSALSERRYGGIREGVSLTYDY